MTSLNAWVASKQRGLTEHWITVDEIGAPEALDKVSWHDLLAAMKRVGLTPPSKLFRENTNERFLNYGATRQYLHYALKRSRSKHPHNARWRVVGDLFIAAKVAAKLSEGL